jgi:hypothetical protein
MQLLDMLDGFALRNKRHHHPAAQDHAGNRVRPLLTLSALAMPQHFCWICMSTSLNCKPRLALFDLDHTLLPLDSDHGWGEFSIAIGWCDRRVRSPNDAFFADYQAGTLNMPDYVRFATAAVVSVARPRPAPRTSASWTR